MQSTIREWRTMNRDAEIVKSVEKLFPGFAVRRSRKIYNKNSQIHVLEVGENGDREMVAAKLLYNYHPGQVASEFNNLSEFHARCRSERISAPEPLYVHPKRGLLVMRYIEGTNLGWMLHGIRPVDRRLLEEVMDLSAVALFRFHNTFKTAENTPLTIDSISKEKDINDCIERCRERASLCHLNLRTRPFFDFSAWNIMVVEGCQPRIYLIDFPKSDYIFTPHLDLGRFKFSLELIKQYPPSKILGLDWWEAKPLYDRFLRRYCLEMNSSLNGEDRRLIDCFKAANLMRSQDLQRKPKFSWRSWLERSYLRTFSKEWLESTRAIHQ